MTKKMKGICITVVACLVLGVLGGTGLAAERPQRVIAASGSGLVELYEDEVGVTSALFRGAVGLEYEKVTNPNSSFYVVPALTFGGQIPGVKGTVGLKKYIKPTAPEGFWWGVHGSLGLAVDEGIALTIPGGGLNVGYKYFLPKNFIAEWSFGLAYISVTGEDIEISGPGPSVSFKLGYAF